MSRLLEDEGEITRVANVGELQQELRARVQRDRAYLIVLAGSNVGEMYRVEEGETFLGRGQGTTIRLTDDGISRTHARIFQSGGEVVIEDSLRIANRRRGQRIRAEQLQQRHQLSRAAVGKGVPVDE